jgi:hypothetical protein
MVSTDREPTKPLLADVAAERERQAVMQPSHRSPQQTPGGIVGLSLLVQGEPIMQVHLN